VHGYFGIEGMGRIPVANAGKNRCLEQLALEGNLMIPDHHGQRPVAMTPAFFRLTNQSDHVLQAVKNLDIQPFQLE
jgi:hypothetical protein